MNKINRFSVLLGDNVNNWNKIIPSYYTATNASKPLVYFASFFGTQTIKYSGNGEISKLKFKNRVFSLIVILTIVMLLIFVKPVSWQITKDIPLNILTKTYILINITEVIYSILNSSFYSNRHYMKLFNALDDVDSHLSKTKRAFDKTKIFSIGMIILPIFQVSGTFFLRKFHVFNISAHLTFFLVMLQGVIAVFLAFNIYVRQLVLNRLLLNKVECNVSLRQQYVFKRSTFARYLSDIMLESQALDSNKSSWFELMQLYDKVSDAIHWFNKIYSRQIFFMFNSWMVVTLLAICRSLSPSVKYSNVIASDLFMYMFMTSRVMVLANICEYLQRERKKTLAILLQSLVYENEAYLSQVDTMIQLVETKKLGLSAIVFTADVSTALDYTGRVISYSVIFIQYFYNNVF